MLQVSLVHTSVSLHWLLAVQQPACGVNTQVLLVVLQVSVVHEMLSLHWVLVVQQPVTGANAHT